MYKRIYFMHCKFCSLFYKIFEEYGTYCSFDLYLISISGFIVGNIIFKRLKLLKEKEPVNDIHNIITD